ncbi:hypothetical protein EDD15DRAFT_1354145 [Pisolithus albus]|nr:hypothetical protein EDD15DRAFT_1354145 [Pisolithus albus]
MRSTIVVSAFFAMAAIGPVFGASATGKSSLAPKGLGWGSGPNVDSGAGAPPSAATRPVYRVPSHGSAPESKRDWDWTSPIPSPPPIPSCWSTGSCKTQDVQSELQQLVNQAFQEGLITQDEATTLLELAHAPPTSPSTSKRSVADTQLDGNPIGAHRRSDAFNEMIQALEDGFSAIKRGPVVIPQRSTSDPSTLINQAESQLSSLQSTLIALASSSSGITGSAASSIQNLLAEANSAESQLGDVLDELASAIQSAGATYEGTDGSASGSFS